MARDVKIKGTRDGLLVSFGGGDLPLVLAELRAQLSRSPAFFQGGKVALAVGARAMSAVELQEVADLLSEQGMIMWAVISRSPITRESARELGLASAPPPGEEQVDLEAGQEPAIIVRHTLRSGQSVRYPGHVIVVGDVHPGAKIIAGGDIVVWGSLRGTVHAGAMGDDAATVSALQLQPMQLRIGGHISRSPNGKSGRGKQEPRPETAYVQGEDIVAELWRV
jgi:septum site-determining protein MinC